MIGEIVRNVIPYVGRLRYFRGFLECCERFILFHSIQIRLAEADLKPGVIGRENGGLVEFRNGFGVFVLLEEERAERGVRNRIERI